MSSRLATRLMTLDDLELLYVRIFLEFRAISYIWKAATAKRMEIDPVLELTQKNWGVSCRNA